MNAKHLEELVVIVQQVFTFLIVTLGCFALPLKEYVPVLTPVFIWHLLYISI